MDEYRGDEYRGDEYRGLTFILLLEVEQAVDLVLHL
jgi:hypothetical protein